MASTTDRAALAFALFSLIGSALSATESAETPTPVLERAIEKRVLSATLEVVPARDIREGNYGTAFAIGPGQFVTAAHVIEDFVGGAFGLPALQDARGRRYPIDAIERFNNEDDFALVLSKSAPSADALVTREARPAPDEPLWFVGRRKNGGIEARTARYPSPADGQADDPLIVRFVGNLDRGFSGGPLVDRSGAVRGVVTHGVPGKSGAATLIKAVTDGDHAVLSPYTLIAELGVRASQKILYLTTLPKGASFEAFGDALLAARPRAYRRALFDPADPSTTLFVFLGDAAPSICAMLNGKRCEAPPRSSEPLELWRVAPQFLEPDAASQVVPTGAGVYNIHGVIVVRDASSAKPATSLRENERLHLKLARDAFNDAELRRRLDSDYESLRDARTERPDADDYQDTHKRTWKVRTWKLRNEPFSIVSLARETDDQLGHIVLVSVVRSSQIDGASVLVRYVANFTRAVPGN